MKPCTTVRARSLRLPDPRRALRDRRSGADPLVLRLIRAPLRHDSLLTLSSSVLHSRLGHRDGVEELLDDLLRADPFRLGVEVGQDAVAKNGRASARMSS